MAHSETLSFRVQPVFLATSEDEKAEIDATRERRTTRVKCCMMLEMEECKNGRKQVMEKVWEYNLQFSENYLCTNFTFFKLWSFMCEKITTAIKK